MRGTRIVFASFGCTLVPALGASQVPSTGETLFGVALTAESAPLQHRYVSAVAVGAEGDIAVWRPSWEVARREDDLRANLSSGGSQVDEQGYIAIENLRPGRYRVFAVPKSRELPGCALEARESPIELPARELTLHFDVHEVDVEIVDETDCALPAATRDSDSHTERAIGEPDWLQLVELDEMGLALPEFGLPVRIQESPERVLWQVEPGRPYALVAAYPGRPLQVERFVSSTDAGRVRRRLRLGAPAKTATVELRTPQVYESQLEVRELETGALILADRPDEAALRTFELEPGRYLIRTTYGPFPFWCDHGHLYQRSRLAPNEHLLEVRGGETFRLENPSRGGGRVVLSHRVAPGVEPPVLEAWGASRGDQPDFGRAWIRPVGQEQWSRLTFYFPGSTEPNAMRDFVSGSECISFFCYPPGRYEVRMRFAAEPVVVREVELRQAQETLVEVF